MGPTGPSRPPHYYIYIVWLCCIFVHGEAGERELWKPWPSNDGHVMRTRSGLLPPLRLDKRDKRWRETPTDGSYLPLYSVAITLLLRRPASLKPDAAPMPVVKVEPTDEHPLPFDTEEEKTQNFIEEITVAANTADLLEELGAPLEVDPTTLEREKALIDAVAKRQEAKPLKNYSTALAASGFLKTYGQNLAFDVGQVRAALTNKLLEIANCGEIKYELKALELLGKHSDVGLFTERSEITINYNSPEALETAIKERVKRLLNADVIDVTPVGMDLDEELGVYTPVEDEDEDVEDDVEEGEDDE